MEKQLLPTENSLVTFGITLAFAGGTLYKRLEKVKPFFKQHTKAPQANTCKK